MSKVTLFLAFSFLYGCITPPKVIVGVSDPESGGFQTFDQKTDQSGFVPYSQSGNWVAHPPQDYKALIEYCKRKDEK